MSYNPPLEINPLITEEIDKLNITNDEKALLFKLLQFEKQNHNTSGKMYADKYKQFLEETLQAMSRNDQK